MRFPFLALAMRSPGRQRSFRRTVVFHLLVLFGAGGALIFGRSISPAMLGHVLLIAGVIEGAALVGWRLVQLPKSQALEFMLVSPLHPWRVFTFEALVGVGRFALTTLAGVPPLLALTYSGRIDLMDIPPLLLVPFLWGLLTGFGLTAWAYERFGIRRWGERAALVLLFVYLVVGVLAAERLGLWLRRLPFEFSHSLLVVILAFTQYNPFSALESWLVPRDAVTPGHRLFVLLTYSGIGVALLFFRATVRFKGHFHDRHYKPLSDRKKADASGIGNRPLSWWAVRRVMEYSGRLNIWIAGGFGALYAMYTVAGDAWPAWMGRMVFEIFESIGGVPAFATALVVMGAVPAAFQYGLWDASTQDRCKRLELLLVSELDGTDYWLAAASAAWKRGRGYLLVAAIMVISYGWAGRATWVQVGAAVAAAVTLWTFSFAVGFRAFSRGVHANGLGTALTLAIPAIAGILILLRIPLAPAMLPPGAVYLALVQPPDWTWFVGPVLIGAATLTLARSAQHRCERELRTWYDRNQGRKALD